MDVLRVEKLEKTYGRRKVVKDVSFRVGTGEIVGLLGPNGAGKSTSFRMTCGLVQPDSGKVYLGQEDVTNWPMFLRARDGGMGYLAQEPSVFKKLNVEQNISAILEMLGHSWRDRRKRTDELLELLNITHIRDSMASTLSGGERRRLEIARCLVSNPKIIMLDEPYAGVDPINKQSMRPIIHQLQSAGISVLITDHDAQEILRSVDRCYVIDEGTVFYEGKPDAVRRDPQVRKKYLGELADFDLVSSSQQNRVDTPDREPAIVPAPKKGLFERLSPRRRSP